MVKKQVSGNAPKLKKLHFLFLPSDGKLHRQKENIILLNITDITFPRGSRNIYFNFLHQKFSLYKNLYCGQLTIKGKLSITKKQTKSLCLKGYGILDLPAELELRRIFKRRMLYVAVRIVSILIDIIFVVRIQFCTHHFIGVFPYFAWRPPIPPAFY